MKQSINFKKVLVIILISSIIGLVFNLFYSKGIPIIRKGKNIEWVKDSVVLKETDSLNSKKINTGVDKSQEIETTSTNLLKEKREILPSKPTFITLRQAYNLFLSKNVIFIDSRDKWEFAEGHISGAINIPEYSFDKSNPVLTNIQKNNTLITYCGGDDCEMSTKLAENLFILGYKKVFIFFGGWNDWLKAGYPVEKE